jgi:RNA polymerase sigma-70 factor (ECF subfamily)
LDRALIERARGGDREAYARLAQTASHRWFAIALRVLRDDDAARDVLQAALVQVWRDLPSLRDPDRFDAWSYRLVINACRSAQRRSRRPVVALELGRDEPAVSDSQLSVARRDELERAFARLTVEQRVVLVLLYYEDRSIAEIAATLGISAGTVKSRLHAARAALRAAIDADSRVPVRAGEPA